ncbi:hypothetical protein [Lysobacter sp. 1R34A]|uniref:hypothetical protein n=1 Tax=Lysobacter sp. 1R34A TaxID=3445786 RepID=UPI003EED3F65
MPLSARCAALVSSLALTVLAACSREISVPHAEVTAAPPEPAAAPVPEPNAELVVVVGERVALDAVDDPSSLGGGYRARYRVLEQFRGRQVGPMVEFDFHQHIGEPHLLGFTHALLFLRRDGGRLLEVAHYPVFAARAGGWAGCAPVFEMEARQRKDRAQAVRGVFAGEASYTEWLAPEPSAYPAEHFQVSGNRIRCLTGTPAQELSALDEDILETGARPTSLTPEQVEAVTLPMVQPTAPDPEPTGG